MLDAHYVITHEERPIERRGIKRASPLVQFQATFKERVYSDLLGALYFSQTGTVRVANHESQILDLFASSGHLARQANYKRKGTQ